MQSGQRAGSRTGSHRVIEPGWEGFEPASQECGWDAVGPIESVVTREAFGPIEQQVAWDAVKSNDIESVVGTIVWRHGICSAVRFSLFMLHVQGAVLVQENSRENNHSQHAAGSFRIIQ